MQFLLLALSGLLNGWLLVRLRRMVRTRQRARIRPISAENHFNSQLDPPPQPNTPTVVILGDSRAAAWHMPTIAGIRVLNRGIGGETTRQVLLRIERDVVALKPDIVVLQLGVNDLWRLKIFNSAEQQEIIGDAKRSLSTISELIVETGAQLVITTVFPLGRTSVSERLWGSARTQAAIKELNDYFKTLASAKITLFDSARPICNRSGFVKSRYLKNYLHLNETGYNALNAELIPLLRNLTST